MHAIVIDDERLAVEEMVRLLDSNDKIDNLKGFVDAKQGLEYLLIHNVDIAFIDISMPELTGTQIMKELNGHRVKTKVIFVTAYDNYAVEAYALEVADYVMKPVSARRINKSVDKIYEQLYIENVPHQMKNKRKRLTVWKNNSVQFIKVEDICYFEVVGKTLTAVTLTERFVLSESLLSIMEELGDSTFCQCYKGIAVNLDWVDKISPLFNQTFEIHLKGLETRLPVSRHYGTQMRQKLGF